MSVDERRGMRLNRRRLLQLHALPGADGSTLREALLRVAEPLSARARKKQAELVAMLVEGAMDRSRVE